MTEESNRVVRVETCMGVMVILGFQPDGVWNQLRYTILGRKVYVGEDFLKGFSEWGNTFHTVGGTFWWPRHRDLGRRQLACLPAFLESVSTQLPPRPRSPSFLLSASSD